MSNFHPLHLIRWKKLDPTCGTVCLPISDVSPLFLHSRNILKHTCLKKDRNSFNDSFQQQWTRAYESTEFRRNMLGVLSSLKKSKNPWKTRIGRTPNTHPPIHIFNFFWKHLETWKQHKKHKETQNLPQKIQIRVGAWPTHPLPSFSRIFEFC